MLPQMITPNRYAIMIPMPKLYERYGRFGRFVLIVDHALCPYTVWLRGVQESADDVPTHCGAHLLGRLLTRVVAQLLLSQHRSELVHGLAHSTTIILANDWHVAVTVSTVR